MQRLYLAGFGIWNLMTLYLLINQLHCIFIHCKYLQDSNMATAEYQRARRAKLKASGNVCRLQSEISTRAALALIHLTTVRGQTTRAVLEDLILREVEHAAV